MTPEQRSDVARAAADARWAARAADGDEDLAARALPPRALPAAGSDPQLRLASLDADADADASKT